MRIDSAGDRRRSDPVDGPGSHGRLIPLVLIVIALVLAVSFFYLTNDKRRDRPAQSVTNAAASVDHAARAVGDAARNAANDMSKEN